MIVLRGPFDVCTIPDLEIRILAQQRFAEICGDEPYDYDLHGYMIVVEPGDTAEAVEEESGCRIVHNLLDDSRFGDPDFAPSFEALEEHAGCYEMVFILNDEGFGINIFVPKRQGIDAELLAIFPPPLTLS